MSKVKRGKNIKYILTFSQRNWGKGKFQVVIFLIIHWITDVGQKFIFIGEGFVRDIKSVIENQSIDCP